MSLFLGIMGRHSEVGVCQFTTFSLWMRAYFNSESKNLNNLQDIMLDEGRRPKALLQGKQKSHTILIPFWEVTLSSGTPPLVDICECRQLCALVVEFRNKAQCAGGISLGKGQIK